MVIVAATDEMHTASLDAGRRQTHMDVREFVGLTSSVFAFESKCVGGAQQGPVLWQPYGGQSTFYQKHLLLQPVAATSGQPDTTPARRYTDSETVYDILVHHALCDAATGKFESWLSAS